MIAYNCPLGKMVCDGCNYLNTSGILRLGFNHLKTGYDLNHDSGVKRMKIIFAILNSTLKLSFLILIMILFVIGLNL